MSGLSIIISLIPVLVVILIITFALGIVRRVEHRADERLKLEKENIALQQQHLQEISNRLTKIENILREVD